MTVSEVNIMSKMDTMRKVGEDGLTGIQRAGMKTKESHLANVDEYGMNGYQRIASSAIIKSNLTKIESGLVSEDTLDATVFFRYERIIEDLIRNIKADECLPIGITLVRNNSKEDGYQIDHMYSITQGYTDKISPLVIGSIENCQLLTWQDNIKKGNSCSISKSELISNNGYTPQESDNEFDRIICVLEDDMRNRRPHSTLDVLKRANALDNYKKVRDYNKGTTLKISKF